LCTKRIEVGNTTNKDHRHFVISHKNPFIYYWLYSVCFQPRKEKKRKAKQSKAKQQMGCRKKERLLPNPWWQCQNMICFLQKEAKIKGRGGVEVMLILERRWMEKRI
jgi:hypothetical protein